MSCCVRESQKEHVRTLEIFERNQACQNGFPPVFFCRLLTLSP